MTLREVSEDDLPTLFEHQRDPESTRMAAFQARDEPAFRAHWARILADPSAVTRAVLVDGQLAGNVVSFEEAGCREVGYMLGREHWGRGVATRALTALLQVVVARPLYAVVAARNRASLRVLEKCGFATVPSDRAPIRLPEDGSVEWIVLALPGN